MQCVFNPDSKLHVDWPIGTYNKMMSCNTHPPHSPHNELLHSQGHLWLLTECVLLVYLYLYVFTNAKPNSSTADFLATESLRGYVHMNAHIHAQWEGQIRIPLQLARRDWYTLLHHSKHFTNSLTQHPLQPSQQCTVTMTIPAHPLTPQSTLTGSHLHLLSSEGEVGDRLSQAC